MGENVITLWMVHAQKFSIYGTGEPRKSERNRHGKRLEGFPSSLVQETVRVHLPRGRTKDEARINTAGPKHFLFICVNSG